MFLIRKANSCSKKTVAKSEYWQYYIYIVISVFAHTLQEGIQMNKEEYIEIILSKLKQINICDLDFILSVLLEIESTK